MTGLLEKSVKKLDRRCLTEGRLNKEGCKVLMTDTPHPRLVIDFDKKGSPLPRDSHRCDYLLITEGRQDFGWVVLLELKRGRIDAGAVVEQLRAGASAAEKIVPKDEEIRFRPVVSCGNVHKHEWTELKRKSPIIQFHGHKEYVRVMKCGRPLNSVLDG